MCIGIMVHIEAMATKVTAGASMRNASKTIAVEIVYIECIRHRLRIPPAGFRSDAIWLAFEGTNAGLEVDQVGASLMAGIIALKLCVVETDVNRVTGLHIAVNIVVAFVTSGIGSP